MKQKIWRIKNQRGKYLNYVAPTTGPVTRECYIWVVDKRRATTLLNPNQISTYKLPLSELFPDLTLVLEEGICTKKSTKKVSI